MVNEQELILRARRGNRQAFAELVKAYQQRIFLTVLRLIGNEEEAKELTQDAFISAYQAIKGFRLHSGFYTWLYRIALNLSYHRLRSSQFKLIRKTKSLEEPISPEEGKLIKDFTPSQTPDAYQTLVSEEERQLIRKALASLKKKFYSVIVLHDLEGLSYKEIAQIQHCSLGTVMSRLHRGRLQLAEKLKKLGINLD